jgi:hypothetical protein
MENRDKIYELAQKLDMIIEVWRNDVYIGKFKFINGKLKKLKDETNS